MPKRKKKAKNKKIPRDSKVYEQLASEYVVPATPLLDRAAETARKLYNSGLYVLRQSLFKNKGILFYEDLNRIFKKKRDQRESMLYAQMPTVKSAQQTLRALCDTWKGWSNALKSYKAAPQTFTGRPRLPKYLRDRRHTFYVTNQDARIDKNGVLVIHSLDFKLKLMPGIQKINRVTFKPLVNGYKVTVAVVQPEDRQKPYLPDNGRYVGIDPGVDNAFACVSNTGVEPMLINGRALKSVNQYYNKERARLKHLQARYHQLESTIQTKQGPKKVYAETKTMKRITDWRNRKIYEFAHKASKRIVEYALSCEANTIVIGKNKSWKRSANMGKKNNQNFIGIPHKTIIDMITYKANLEGITVIWTNESYTSQTSALDGEKPCWENGNKSRLKQGKSPAARRIRRGLFRSNKGLLVNADVNGAMQIIRKVFPSVSFDGGIADAVLHPFKWSPLI